MITKRDQNILNFLDEFHIATSNQLHQLFFDTSVRYSRKRLQYLCDHGYIKKARSTIDNCYAYYAKKPAQVHHDLIRTELYVYMKNNYELLEWNNEYPIDSIRPDALCYIKEKTVIPIMIEIHLSNKFDFGKYKGIDFLTLFGVPPTVLICTDRQVTVPNNMFKVVNLNMLTLKKCI